MSTRNVDMYVDPVSPYAWLALTQVESFCAAHDCRIQLRPVVYGALLSATGLIGPVEAPAKRRYTFRDIARQAAALGLPCSGPPAHPYRSLEALRLITAVRMEDPAAALPVAIALARAAWEQGLDLTDADVLARFGPADRVGEPEVKAALRSETEQALERGVFGVPTFALGDELFWGHDRMAALGRALDGEAADVDATAEAMIGRPSGADRKR